MEIFQDVEMIYGNLKKIYGNIRGDLWKKREMRACGAEGSMEIFEISIDLFEISIDHSNFHRSFSQLNRLFEMQYLYWQWMFSRLKADRAIETISASNHSGTILYRRNCKRNFLNVLKSKICAKSGTSPRWQKKKMIVRLFHQQYLRSDSNDRVALIDSIKRFMTESYLAGAAGPEKNPNLSLQFYSAKRVRRYVKSSSFLQKCEQSTSKNL